LWSLQGGSLFKPQISDRSSGAFPWYALRVKHRHEKAVAQSLQAKGYPAFLPLFRARQRCSRRRTDVQMPFFPGYVFCRLNVLDRLPVLIIPGIFQIVRLGKLFAPVSETEIQSLQVVVNSDLSARPWPFLKAGQAVLIDEGPLRGLAGNLTEVGDKATLVVSVTLLQRSVAVEVDRRWVHPMYRAAWRESA
jgi:transcription antitermination factor NusG